MEPLLQRAGQRAAEVERQAAQDIERFASQQMAEAEAAEGFASAAEVAAAGAETVETGGALSPGGGRRCGRSDTGTGGRGGGSGRGRAMEGGVTAASHMLGWGAETGGGTDSDASRPSRATDVQTLNGMQESGAVDHFFAQQLRRQPQVYRIGERAAGPASATDPSPPHPAPGPTPFGINQVPIPVSSDSDRISRQSRSDRGPLGTQGSARPFAQPSFDALRQASEPEAA